MLQSIQKEAFNKRWKIDFIDLISEIEAEKGRETNYHDHYLIKREKITRTEVNSVIENLKFLQQVCFYQDYPWGPELVMNSQLLIIEELFILGTGKTIDFTAHPYFLELRKDGSMHFSFLGYPKSSEGSFS